MTLKLWFSCSSLPKISYMKALDIYLAFCFCMVFGALLEYATVTYSGKRIKMNQAKLAEFQLLVEEMRADLGRKLKLDSPEDAEFIVAKAIRDGVIEAELDHEHGIMQSKDTSDVYSTREPQKAFNQRIEWCLDLHNHSVS